MNGMKERARRVLNRSPKRLSVAAAWRLLLLWLALVVASPGWPAMAAELEVSRVQQSQRAKNAPSIRPVMAAEVEVSRPSGEAPPASAEAPINLPIGYGRIVRFDE